MTRYGKPQEFLVPGGAFLCYDADMKLSDKKCIPCESNQVKPMSKTAALKMVKQVPGWKCDATAKHIAREFLFKDFKSAMKFVTTVAKIAESNGHHPDISIWYNKVRLDLWTHSIGGLSENDFIVAAKVNEIQP